MRFFGATENGRRKFLTLSHSPLERTGGSLTLPCRGAFSSVDLPCARDRRSSWPAPSCAIERRRKTETRSVSQSTRGDAHRRFADSYRIAKRKGVIQSGEASTEE